MPLKAATAPALLTCSCAAARATGELQRIPERCRIQTPAAILSWEELLTNGDTKAGQPRKSTAASGCVSSLHPGAQVHRGCSKTARKKLRTVYTGKRKANPGLKQKSPTMSARTAMVVHTRRNALSQRATGHFRFRKNSLYSALNPRSASPVRRASCFG